MIDANLPTLAPPDSTIMRDGRSGTAQMCPHARPEEAVGTGSLMTREFARPSAEQRSCTLRPLTAGRRLDEFQIYDVLDVPFVGTAREPTWGLVSIGCRKATGTVVPYPFS